MSVAGVTAPPAAKAPRGKGPRTKRAKKHAIERRERQRELEGTKG